MSYPKQSGPFIHRPRIKNPTSKKTSDLIGRTVNERSNQHGIVCLLERKCLTCNQHMFAHRAARGFRGEKNNIFAWVRVRIQKKSQRSFKFSLHQRIKWSYFTTNKVKLTVKFAAGNEKYSHMGRQLKKSRAGRECFNRIVNMVLFVCLLIKENVSTPIKQMFTHRACF